MEGHLYWKIKDEASHEKYGTYLFGPLDEPPYTGHSDGRHSTFTKKVTVLSNRKLYQELAEALKEEYKLTVYDPYKFVMVDFQKSVRDADLCITDYNFYKDVVANVTGEYHVKFNLVCSDISETQYYGSEPLYDSFSVSISEESLRPHIKRETRLVRPDVMDDWRVLFKSMIHKQFGVRIYTKGSFDLFNCGHVSAFEELKRSYPKSVLTIGVLKEAGPTVLTHAERIASVRGCKYVDEVICDPPATETEAFLKKYAIDIVATDTMDLTIPCKTLIPIRYKGPDIVGRILKE
jgi:glycerol-3-phosphate cytidylyltransferase-like family protein